MGTLMTCDVKVKSVGQPVRRHGTSGVCSICSILNFVPIHVRLD